MKKQKRIYYKREKQIYTVLSNSFLGDTNLYKLASNFSGGSSFSAHKSDCMKIHDKNHKK